MNNWIGTKLMAALITLVVSFTANAQTANSILGKWKDADYAEKQIEIINQSGNFFGKTINSSKPAKNGKIILKDLIWIDASKSYKGTLINPDNGEASDVVIRMFGTDRFKFSVSKYFFTRTFTFNRIAQ